MADDKNPRETLWELVKEIRFAMITHRHPDGTLRACPMTMANKEGMDEHVHFYFLINKQHDLAQCVGNDAQIQISFADPEEDSYVSVSSSAHLSEDRALKEKLWSTQAQAWFPGGVEDPDLAVLVAPVSSAEYWNVKENQLVQLFKMAKAAVTGEPPKGMGEHKTVQV
ncbi:pyridoxamine 5'-phosphate oxidase family protein [Comamonas endophytica]|uniref:Pyridoxamine 5'-phosphate oxidase family protein n=1 Tax=Comamonas endophytica TaxID=2949090 RepID=A0ABY6G5U6_9BURK|nr:MULTISPECIES: pyridoxamine 5'-phosphate oxidase family protein [unclassified Acidovorax]MCD2512272.1 pyridoxamine 5'-phosphate oxidase family protein [Acidovorax sp. D4N7]UYG50271.1 pyridoxamine 5'-phosphate oxidase family protein [Acidovorax sp. 5MLIR]